MRSAKLGLLALAGGLALATQAGAERLLIMGVPTAPSALDPHYHNTPYNTQALSQIFEPLFLLGPQVERIPRLATGLVNIDDLTWELTLRQGVRFHDGTPFEAEDVTYTFARVPTVPNSPGLFTANVRTVATVEVVAPDRIRIRTREPNPLLPWDLTGLMILSRRVHGPAPSTAEFNSGKLAIGTGPYRLVSYTLNERLEIVANRQYWGAPAPWDRVITRYIPQGSTRVAALLAGEVDLIDYVPVQDIGRLRGEPRVVLFTIDSMTFVYLAPDAMRDTSPYVFDRQGRPLPRNPLGDRRVREALSLAINREAISENVYQGMARPADQFAAPTAEHRLEGLPPLPHDAARARQLLAEAGYPEGFRITLHGPKNFFASDDNLLQAIAQGLSRIGVQAEVQTLPAANLFSRATNREFSLFMTFFQSALALNPLRQVAMTRDPDLGHGAFNRQRYSNPAVDVPARAALTTMDEEQRRELTQQAARALLEDKGVIPVIVLRSAWAAQRGRVVYEPHPFNYTSALFARPAE